MAKPKSEHRWEWPEEAARVSDWLTVEELRALAGKKTAERGDQFGCIIYYSNGAHQRGALVERRAAQKTEPGKWRYRLIDPASLLQVYLDSFDVSPYTLDTPELGLNVLRQTLYSVCPTPRLMVYFDYNPDHIAWLKERGAKWDPTLRGWFFQDEREFEQLTKQLKARFGVDQEQRYLNITLSVEALLPKLLSHTTCTAFGREVLSRDFNWNKLIAAAQVSLVGELERELVLVIERVPSSLYAQDASRWGAYIRDVKVWTADAHGLPPNAEATSVVGETLKPALKRASLALKRPPGYPPYELDPPELGADLAQWLKQLIRKLNTAASP